MIDTRKFWMVFVYSCIFVQKYESDFGFDFAYFGFGLGGPFSTLKSSLSTLF